MTSRAGAAGAAREAVRGVVAAAADLVLARTCAGCGAAGPALCDPCAAPLLRPAALAWPTPAPAGLPAPYAVAPYAGAVRAAVLAHKEDGRLALARPLGAALAVAVHAALVQPGDGRLLTCRVRSGGVLLVPAPSRRAAVRARGHDATLRLARVAAGRLRRVDADVAVTPVLRPARVLADQADLSAEGRWQNLAGALRVPPRLEVLVTGRAVVVVDDVITSGATLAESARALRATGARVVAVATVAATARTCAPGDGPYG